MNTGLLLAIIIIIIVVFAWASVKNNESYNEHIPKYLNFNKHTRSQYQNKKKGCQPYGDRTEDIFSAFFSS
jgi:hypothetical protein